MINIQDLFHIFLNPEIVRKVDFKPLKNDYDQLKSIISVTIKI
ncbi:hypothetical protein ACRPMK_08420 [Streptococcus uberis]|nr:hypothetical protein [Streptococcus uberis]